MSELSLRDYLKAQREDRIHRKAQRMTFPVPGYEQKLAAQYRILEFEEKRSIGARHDNAGTGNNDGKDLVELSADGLINACVDLLEITGHDEAGKPVYQSLGMTWMAPVIADLFAGVQGVNVIPQQTTAIQALRMVLDGDQIMDHFEDVGRESKKILAEAAQETAGEPQPSAEG
jgi:hypothetical protein